MTRLRRIEVRDRIFFITFNIARGVASLSASGLDVVLATLQDYEDRTISRFMAMLSCPTTLTCFFTQKPFRCQKSCAT